MVKKILLLMTFLMASTCFSKEIIKVAIIDSGLDLEDWRFKPYLCDSRYQTNLTSEDMTDYLGHGTHIAGTIIKNAGNGNYCLIIIKMFSRHGTVDGETLLQAMLLAIKFKAKYVNYSGGGEVFYEPEYNLIKENPQITVIAAAGNEHLNLDYSQKQFYPASYKLDNVISVGALDSEGNTLPISNYGNKIKAWEIGIVKSTLPKNGYGFLVGTSMSAAVHTGKLLLKELKHENH